MSNMEVKIDKVWWYYHKTEPKSNDLSPAISKRWAFSINAEIKYLPGTYAKAVELAKAYARSVGTKEIYLRA